MPALHFNFMTLACYMLLEHYFCENLQIHAKLYHSSLKLSSFFFFQQKKYIQINTGSRLPFRLLLSQPFGKEDKFRAWDNMFFSEQSSVLGKDGASVALAISCL